MVILFTLWYLLNWQFPTWLWVVAGLLLLGALTSPNKRKKRYKVIRSIQLPLPLLMALIFGTDVLGNSILPSDVTFWSFVLVVFASIILNSFTSRADKEIKKAYYKAKAKDEDNEEDGGSKVEIDINSDDELKLNINIKNKEKNKSSNFNIGLENGFIKELFIKNIVLKGIKQNSDLKDANFDLVDLYKKAVKNPVKGPLLTVDNEKVIIVISIK